MPAVGSSNNSNSGLHAIAIPSSNCLCNPYDNDSDLNKIQRDRLLLRYQHQLGVVIARIKKLETVSKHPDLGPLGEGLITLMDQKLSQLDQRL